MNRRRVACHATENERVFAELGKLTLVVPQAQVLWQAVAAQVLRSGGLAGL
jgi:hypothetical protein